MRRHDAELAPCLIHSSQGKLSILRELIDFGFEFRFLAASIRLQYSGVTSLWHSRLSTGLSTRGGNSKECSTYNTL